MLFLDNEGMVNNEKDHIVNGINPENGEFDYISLVTEEKYKTGVHIRNTLLL